MSGDFRNDARTALAKTSALSNPASHLLGDRRHARLAGCSRCVPYSAEDGNQLWVARYNGPGNSDDKASAIAVNDSGVFVTGQSLGATQDYATIGYSMDGLQLWIARYEGPMNSLESLWSADDVASSIVVSGSKVFVTGASVEYESYSWRADYATIAYSADDGRQLWAARYSGSSDSYDRASALALSPDGMNVFVTGDSDLDPRSYGGDDAVTIAYRTSSCLSGRDTTGTVSGPVGDFVVPSSGPASAYVHGVNCDIISPAGL